MTGVEILNEIITIMVGAITPVAEGVGAGLSTLATSIFISGTGETAGLSVFGSLVVVFSAIALGLSLCRWVVNFITSLGQRNS